LAKGKQGLKDPTTLPYLRVANVQDGYLDLADIKEIQVERSEVERYRLQEADVLLTEGGDNDKLGRGDVWRGQIPVCLHQNHVFVVRTQQNVLDPYFLSALAGSSYGKLYFRRCSKQSTNLATINSTQLREFPVILPPKHEQLAIVRCLGTWDEAIALTERRIAAGQQRKQGLMQRLLTGQVRFPEFVGQPWRETAIENVAEVIMGQSPASANYNDQYLGLPLIQGNADIVNRQTAPRAYTTEITKRCNPNDIILSVRAPVGTVALSSHEACIGRGVCAIRARTIDLGFLYQILIFIEPKWGTFAQGSTFTAINSRDINQFRIQVPATLPEQRRIAEVLAACDRELDLLARKRDALQRQKRGLMQQLLTGRVRVKGLDHGGAK
jgi:type I restriction enzyme S subunit